MEINLGNAGSGNLAFMKSDNIGVVTRWDWPTDKSFVEGVSPDQLRSIKNGLLIGKHRKSDQSDDWAGHIVGKVLGIDTDKTNKTGRARVARMLETWIKTGELETYKAKDENYTLRDFIRTP